MSGSFFDLSVSLAAQFADSNQLIMHIICNEKERILVFPYYKDTLLSLLLEDELALYLKDKLPLLAEHELSLLQEDELSPKLVLHRPCS